MRNYFLLFLFGVLLQSCLPAKKEILAFAYKDQGKVSSDERVNHKFQIAKMVFDSLVEGQGDFRMKRPTLAMSKSEMYVAWAEPGKAEIGLEELAYDVCVSFGADSLNALAALLTHELVHYYEKHEWNRHFVKEHADLPTAQKLRQLEEGLKLEAQADYQGGFLAYSVGFDVHGIMPELLKKIYSKEAYDLPEDIEGYPSLADRIAMSKTAMDRLYELQIVAETAVCLSLLESYNEADKYFNYILNDFQSRDIYNNAGVNVLLSSLQLFTKKEMPYSLPIEMDPDSRLRKPVTRDSDLERIELREELIQTAQGYFDRAILMDKQYAPAYLNKAVSFALLGDWYNANHWMKEAGEKNLTPKIQADVQVLKGVVAALQQDVEGAKEWWMKASASQNYLADINMQIMENGPLQAIAGRMGFASKKEQIGELDLDAFLYETAPDRAIVIDKKTKCGYYEKDNSNIYVHVIDDGQSFISVQMVNDAFSGKSMEGIQIGDGREKLLEVYGQPHRQIQAPNGEFLVYKDRLLFFQLNSAAEVIGWGVYRRK